MKNIQTNLIFIFALYIFSIINLTLANENKKDKNLIFWKKLENELFFKNIKWNSLSEEEKIKVNQSKEDSEKNNGLTNSPTLFPYEIGPFIPQNIFPLENDFVHYFKQKSSFDGGDAKGTGNQIYSYKFHYGFSEDLFFSGFISEADDPLYHGVKDFEDHKNFWRNYGLSFNKKLFVGKNSNQIISLNSSIEYWEINSLFKDNHDSIVYSSGHYLAGTFSLPLTKKLGKRLQLAVMPRIHLLPQKIGHKNKSGKFYGNSFSIGTGLIIKLKKDLYISNTYSIPFGPGYNSYDQNLNFSRKDIYSFNLGWDPNKIININAAITNSFGESPATSLLTIPSGNETLYSISLRLIPNNEDILQKDFDFEDSPLLFGGLTVGNGLVPEQGFSQFYLNVEEKGNYFGFYGYSLSNIFQIEVVNLGTFNSKDKHNYGNLKTKQTFFSEGNLNNRFGGKLNILSPLRGDPFWLSTRLTFGRDQKSVQGYTFSELIGTFKINKKINLNLNPKYSWSGIESNAATGIGLSYLLTKKSSLISELNLNHTNSNQNNNTIAIRYTQSPYKSLDMYYGNALGIQDIGQQLKSSSKKIGLRFNFLY